MTVVEEMIEDPLENPPLWSLHSLRMHMAILISCAMLIQGLMRGSFGMAVVCFVPEKGEVNGTLQLGCNGEEKTIEKTIKAITSEYTVDWSSSELSSIHTAFYIGSFISVLLVDKVNKKFGAKKVLTIGTTLSAIGCLLSPLVIIAFPTTFPITAVRFVMGIGYAFVIPCGSVIISRWFPTHERSTAMAVFTTGNQIGIAIAMLLTSRICELTLLGGWPISFEVYGIFALFFVAMWFWRAANKPREHSHITACELEYITGRASSKARAVSVVVSTPYKKIFTSTAVLSICLCSFSQSFVVIGLVTYLPQYYQQALHMDLSSNGLFSSVPFIVQVVTKLSFALLADNLKARNVSVDLITKSFNALASFGAAACIILISFFGCAHSTLILILMAVSMGLFSGFVPGYNTSIVTIAPQFTSTVSVYSQIYSQMGSALVPVIVGLTTPNGTVEEWRRVFYILAGVLAFSGLFFQIFGTAHPEPWGEISHHSERPSLLVTTERDEEWKEETNGVNGTIVEESENHLSPLSSFSTLSLPKRISRVSYNDVDEVIRIPSTLDINEPISDDDSCDRFTVTDGMA